VKYVGKEITIEMMDASNIEVDNFEEAKELFDQAVSYLKKYFAERNYISTNNLVIMVDRGNYSCICDAEGGDTDAYTW